MATLKQRKSPTASATLFPVGTKRTGNDGGQWMVEANKNGVRRWIAVKQGVRKTVKAAQAKKSYKSSFDLYYKQSQACKGHEEGKCDPFMKEELLYDLYWSMGFPNNPSASMSQYDTAIGFWGDSVNTAAAKEVVRREYTKLKERGAISQFVIKDAKM
jgi:hypothetical protein